MNILSIQDWFMSHCCELLEVDAPNFFPLEISPALGIGQKDTESMEE
jgi:hypothetical protein